MTVHAMDYAHARIDRVNQAIRFERMLWVEVTLDEIWSAIDRALLRSQSPDTMPEKGVMTLTTRDGWRDYRDTWRINPVKIDWLLDDHGQLYLYRPERPRKPIPYSQSALRERSMGKYDREAARDQQMTQTAKRDTELIYMLDNIERMFADSV